MKELIKSQSFMKRLVDSRFWPNCSGLVLFTKLPAREIESRFIMLHMNLDCHQSASLVLDYFVHGALAYYEVTAVCILTNKDRFCNTHLIDTSTPLLQTLSAATFNEIMIVRHLFLAAESPAGVIKVTKPTPPPPPPASQQTQGITQKEAKEAPKSLGGSREETRVRFKD